TRRSRTSCERLLPTTSSSKRWFGRSSAASTPNIARRADSGGRTLEEEMDGVGVPVHFVVHGSHELPTVLAERGELLVEGGLGHLGDVDRESSVFPAHAPTVTQLPSD